MATDNSLESSTRIDVALSFAGPERYFAESVARHLEAFGLEVFHFSDEQERMDLLGGHLKETLTSVYGHQARYCVLFLSKAYSESEYTRHELNAMVKRLNGGDRSFILPLSFDRSTFPELADLVYESCREKTPAAVARFLFYRISGQPPGDQPPGDELVIRFLPTGAVDLPAFDSSLDWVRESTRSFDRPFKTRIEYDQALTNWLAYYEKHLASATPTKQISEDAISQCSRVLVHARSDFSDEVSRMSEFLASVYSPGWDEIDQDGLSTTLRLTAEAKYFALYRLLYTMRLISMDQPHWPQLIQRYSIFTSLQPSYSTNVLMGLPFAAPVADPTGVWLECDLECGDESLDRVLLPADRVLMPRNEARPEAELGRDLVQAVVLPQAAERVLTRPEPIQKSILEGCRRAVTYKWPCRISRERIEDIVDVFTGRRGPPGNMPHDVRRRLLKSVSERLQIDGKWSKAADGALLSKLAEILGVNTPQ
jgi:hypothetical protein